MNTLVNNIMTAIQGDQHLIINHDVDEIVLALTCNLDDLRTLAYARSHFPGFFERHIDGFSSVVTAVEMAASEEEKAKYLNPAKNSVIILESAYNAFNDRLEKYKKNE